MTGACARDLLAGAALDALPDDEAARLEQHLRVCPGCQAELVGVCDAVTCLALAVPQLPPPRRLLVRILSEAIAEARVRSPVAV